MATYKNFMEFLLWLSRLRTQYSVHEEAGSIPGLTQWLRIRWPLVWELPYAAGVAVKKKEKKKTDDPKHQQGNGVTRIFMRSWQNSKTEQPLWNKFWQFFIRLNVHPPCDPAMLLPGIYPRATKTYSPRDLDKDIQNSSIHEILKLRKAHLWENG